MSILVTSTTAYASLRICREATNTCMGKHLSTRRGQPVAPSSDMYSLRSPSRAGYLLIMLRNSVCRFHLLCAPKILQQHL